MKVAEEIRVAASLRRFVDRPRLYLPVSSIIIHRFRSGIQCPIQLLRPFRPGWSSSNPSIDTVRQLKSQQTNRIWRVVRTIPWVAKIRARCLKAYSVSRIDHFSKLKLSSTFIPTLFELEPPKLSKVIHAHISMVLHWSFTYSAPFRLACLVSHPMSIINPPVTCLASVPVSIGVDP